MIKKLIIKLWSMRAQFIRYFIIGINGVVLDILTLWLLKKYLNVNPTVAVVINQIFLINYVFLLNKYWAFKARGMGHKQIVKFYLVAGLNYLISVAWMWFFNHQLHYNYIAVRIVNIALAVSWNFLLYKYFVYANSSTPIPPLTNV